MIYLDHLLKHESMRKYNMKRRIVMMLLTLMPMYFATAYAKDLSEDK